MDNDHDKNGKGKIEVNNLTVAFHGRKTVYAVNDITFKVPPQEFLCFVGTSGCGKTTLLNVIAGFIKPTSGELLLDGSPIQEPSHQRAMVFQRHALFPWKTVRENVEFGLKMKGMDKTQRKSRAESFIKLVGLEGFENSYPGELSGGMEQRVGIARVFANDPLVMLMDEPFGSLDAQTRLMMQELLIKIWEENHKTVIFVTHDIDEAILLADRIIVLTAQPGQLKKEIIVDLPRPRNSSLILSHAFIKLKEEIMGLVREETLKMMNHRAI